MNKKFLSAILFGALMAVSYTHLQASGLAAVQHSNTETDSKALSSCFYSGGFTLSLYADQTVADRYGRVTKIQAAGVN